MDRTGGGGAAFLPPGGLAWDRTFEVETSDGVRLRAATWNQAGSRGHVIYLNGRTEFVEKVALPAAHLTRMRFAVASLDWRGQGLSDRLSEPAIKGHIDHYDQYYSDLEAFVAAPEIAGLGGPRLVFGHSMGGLIAAGALLRGTLDAKAAVLSAPMFGIAMTRVDRLAIVPLIAAARKAGWMHGWPPIRDTEKPYVAQGFVDNLLTADEAVFGWMVEALERDPRLMIGMPSLGWLSASFDEAEAVAKLGAFSQPVLVLLGSEEKVVNPAEVRAGALRHGGRLVEIEGARHELLVEAPEIRGKAWAAIDSFLEDEGL